MSLLVGVGCSSGSVETSEVDTPVPTRSALFAEEVTVEDLPEELTDFFDEETPEPVETAVSDSATAVPPTATPLQSNDAQSDDDETPPTDDDPFSEDLIYNFIYIDQFDPNWTYQTDRVTVDIAETRSSHSFNNSMAATFEERGSRIYFVLDEKTVDSYRREETLGFGIYIYNEDEPIEPGDFYFGVLGSNTLSYWDANDTSSYGDEELLTFSGERRYGLSIDRPIPPKTWFQVSFYLDFLVYDPDFENFPVEDIPYEFVTGFYLESDSAEPGTQILIDTVELFEIQSENGISAEAASDGNIQIVVDAGADVHPISPYIYGLSTFTETHLSELQPPFLSWGGDVSARYNWELGEAANLGQAEQFQNRTIEEAEGVMLDLLLMQRDDAETAVRLAIPTIGWVAKNISSCAFPLPDGTCGDGQESICNNRIETADPTLTSQPVDPEFVTDWLTELQEGDSGLPAFIAIGNEPELWGFTHYDVHPDCTTYEEILETYLTYATAVRAIAPTAELTGPVTCCWFYYWNSAAGDGDKRQHDNQPFLNWFLEQVRAHDQENEVQTLDVLDLHYYPEAVFNDEVDAETAAWRLRSTRSLWDETYVDESWIGEPVNLIPRMRELIAETYPGLRFGLSEWGWGATETMNGALAISEVLGILGRENVYYAAHSPKLTVGSPGFLAFQLYANADGDGLRFGDTSVSALSSQEGVVSSYAALDSETGALHIMLLNKNPDQAETVDLTLNRFVSTSKGLLFRIDQSRPDEIFRDEVALSEPLTELTLPAYSITHLVLEPEIEQENE